MKKLSKRFLTLAIACVMAMAMAVPAFATATDVKDLGESNITYVNNEKTGKTDAIKVVSDDNGNATSYGWHDIVKGEKLNVETADFKVFKSGHEVILSIRNGDEEVVAVVEESTASPIFGGRRVASGWYTQLIKESDVITDFDDVATVASVLCTVFGAGTAADFISIAQNAIDFNVKTTYYRKYLHSKVVDSCTQQYYYTVDWYADSSHKTKLGTSKGGIQTVNLC